MRAHSILVASIVVAVGTSASAHGPMLPERFTLARRAALLAAPEGTFSWEVGRLIATPSDGFTAVEDEDRDEQRRVAEIAGLGPDDVARIVAMRAREDDAAAYAAGDGLPEAIRQYAAGAVAFRAAAVARKAALAAAGADAAPDEVGDDERARLLRARVRFEAVLVVPAPARDAREPWAHYMLGRVAARLGDVPSAIRHFEATRALAAEGRPDPLGLAVASYGEQARVHLRSGDVARAVDLYGRQAGHGSYSGVASLKRVVATVVSDPALLDQAMADPLTRRLVFAYAFTHGMDGAADEDEFLDDEPADANDADEAPAPQPDVADEGVDDPGVLLGRLADAVERADVVEVDGADWVAAAAYRDGEFDVARRLVGRSKTPLARLVTAKLDVRDGDQDAALASYEAAIAGLRSIQSPPWPVLDENDDVVDATRRLREIDASRGVLLLARGDFSRALGVLLDAGPDHWIDAAYVAEGLLGTNDLKRYVDEHVPPASESAVRAALEAGQPLPAFQLRALLARRLMREERFDEAVAYFDDAEIRRVAQEYVDARRNATSAWRSRIRRAESWYEAATLARFDGIDILAFEMAPDFAVVGGQYDLDAYFAEEARAADDGDDEARMAEGRLHDPSEASRLAQNRPSPAVRYQYRVRAAELAERAADLLPRSSQAFAAVLCDGVTWLMDTMPDRAQALYLRYLREGPYVPWGRQFGYRCPKPDFPAAWPRRVEEALPLPSRIVRRLARRPYAAAALAVLVLLAGAVGLRRYRARRAVPG